MEVSIESICMTRASFSMLLNVFFSLQPLFLQNLNHVACTLYFIMDASSFSLPVILAYFKRHSDSLAQPWVHWLLSPCAQIAPGLLEEPTGRRRACDNQPAPPPTHSLLSPRHEPFLPAPIRQGNRLLHLNKWWVLYKECSFKLVMLLLPLGTCGWCVWSLLPAIDWNGAPAAISDQEDCWHQPTHPTSCLWPFLVLLSVGSKPLSENDLCAFPFQPLSSLQTQIQLLTLSPFSLSVSDDSTDTIRQEASQKAAVVYLRLKGKIPPAEGSAHSWLPCAQHQEAPGGAGHLPPCWCGHSHFWLSSAVRHPHQSGKWIAHFIKIPQKELLCIIHITFVCSFLCLSWTLFSRCRWNIWKLVLKLPLRGRSTGRSSAWRTTVSVFRLAFVTNNF